MQCGKVQVRTRGMRDLEAWSVAPKDLNGGAGVVHLNEPKTPRGHKPE